METAATVLSGTLKWGVIWEPDSTLKLPRGTEMPKTGLVYILLVHAPFQSCVCGGSSDVEAAHVCPSVNHASCAF